MTAPTQTETTQEQSVIYCGKPNCPGSTGLRCYRTGVPICMKCAVQTPVGYISKDAAREQENKFYNAVVTDYLIAGAVAFFALLGIGFVLFTFLRFFWIIIFLLSFPAGGLVSEVVWRSIRYRRGRYTAQAVGIGMAAATGLLFLITFNIFALIFGAIATSAAVARFRMGVRI
jgi:hypothetical protein